MPVVAAVNGITVAGGLELVLACDLVLASRDSLIGDAHSVLGLVAGAGATVRLPRRVGPVRAAEMLLVGDTCPAELLQSWGLVNKVVPGAELDAAAAALGARRPARGAKSGRPPPHEEAAACRRRPALRRGAGRGGSSRRRARPLTGGARPGIGLPGVDAALRHRPTRARGTEVGAGQQRCPAAPGPTPVARLNADEPGPVGSCGHADEVHADGERLSRR
jgi:enoyl-CoA hydratase/carnithine racemase